MLSVPHLESTAVVHVDRTEMEVPCSCRIDGQIHCYNNPDVLIAISCVIRYILASRHTGSGQGRLATHNCVIYRNC